MATYLIAGASRGIGLSLVKEILDTTKDTKVIAGVRRPSEEGIQAVLKANPSRLTVIQLDLSDSKSVKAAAESVAKTHPNGIDYLINNAAILGAPDADGDDVLNTLNTNVSGPIRVNQAFLPQVKKGKAKVIVNVSSLVGVVGSQTQQFVATLFKQLANEATYYGYRLSKSALNNYTIMLALDLAQDGITVINLHPGTVDSEGFRNGFTTATPEHMKQFGYITTQESAAKQIQVYHKLTIADSGKFFSYTGDVLQYA